MQFSNLRQVHFALFNKYILQFYKNTECTNTFLNIRPRMTHFAMKSKYIFLKRVPFRRDNNTQLWIYLGRDSQKGHLCLAIPQKEEMPSIRVFEAVANTKSIHFLSSKFIKPCWKNYIEFEKENIIHTNCKTALRETLRKNFGKTWDFVPTREGGWGGLTQSQLF